MVTRHEGNDLLTLVVHVEAPLAQLGERHHAEHRPAPAPRHLGKQALLADFTGRKMGLLALVGQAIGRVELEHRRETPAYGEPRRRANRPRDMSDGWRRA